MYTGDPSLTEHIAAKAKLKLCYTHRTLANGAIVEGGTVPHDTSLVGSITCGTRVWRMDADMLCTLVIRP